MSPQRQRLERWGIAIGMIAAALLVWCLPGWLESNPARIARAKQLIEDRRFREARQICENLLDQDPRNGEVLELAATAAEGLGNIDQALDFLKQISTEPVSPHAATLQARQGNLCINLGRLSEAEDCFRQALKQEFDNPDSPARRQLLFLLRVEGRNWEAQELLRGFEDKPFTYIPEDLYLLATTEWVWLDGRESQFLSHCLEQNPDDPLPWGSQARNFMQRNDYAAAIAMLKRVLGKYPDLWEARARLGYCLTQTAPADKLTKSEADWVKELPDPLPDYPELHFVLGLMSQKQRQPERAIGFFDKVLRRNPNHREANYRLSQLLRGTGDSSHAEVFAQRAGKLTRVEYLVREVQHTPAALQELYQLLRELGRDTEATEWRKMALKQNPAPDWAQSPREFPRDPYYTPAMNFERFFSPDKKIFVAEDSNTSSPSLSFKAARLTFREEAQQAGIDFHYHNGAMLNRQRAYMFEFNGGGVAAADLDGDLWPDLYLSQGGPWPNVEATNSHHDKAYRNLSGQSFSDISARAHLTDARMSQGATVGDFDNDGFQDVYVTNIGSNRLYHNNGDGTFEDVTEETGVAGNDWSLSSAIADMNGDSLPDLYVVNYLSGPDVFTRECRQKGRPVQCFPVSFPAAQDRFYLNAGNGAFEDITDQSGAVRPDGKGMGLVVGDFNGSRRNAIYVANDTTPNFLFANKNGPGNRPEFEELGIVAGVALDDKGIAQSSMGVATGDINGDGRMDLLVTNYLREASNLFIQQADFVFQDHAAQAGFPTSCLNMMKWGTQFLDVEGDGNLDLVIANGHLEDYSTEGVPFKMSTQVFRGLGDGHFQEIPAAELGDYFQRLVLGRAVARLDWNRDGQDDLAITHVDAPLALLTNTTQTVNHRLRLRLRGTSSSRDAIGTTVRVRSEKKNQTYALFAGDGFEARNEAVLNIGLGSATKGDSVMVQWPSGIDQEWKDLSSGTEWLLREGVPTPLVLP